MHPELRYSSLRKTFGPTFSGHPRTETFPSVVDATRQDGFLNTELNVFHQSLVQRGGVALHRLPLSEGCTRVGR